MSESYVTQIFQFKTEMIDIIDQKNQIINFIKDKVLFELQQQSKHQTNVTLRLLDAYLNSLSSMFKTTIIMHLPDDLQTYKIFGRQFEHNQPYLHICIKHNLILLDEIEKTVEFRSVTTKKKEIVREYTKTRNRYVAK